jgi:hypothetical protein
VYPKTSTSPTAKELVPLVYINCTDKYLPLNTQGKSLDGLNEGWFEATAGLLANVEELPTRISKLVSLSWQQSGLLYSRTIQTYTVFSKSIISHGVSVIREMNPMFGGIRVVIPSTAIKPSYAGLATLSELVIGQPPALHARAKFIAGNVGSGQSCEHAPQVTLADTNVRVP